MRESIERFRSGSALSVPADIRQPSSPRVPRVPFCAEEKKTRLPRNPVKEKRKSATLLFQLLLSVTAYRTRSRIPLAQQREDKGEGSCRKGNVCITNRVVIVNSIVEKLCNSSKEDSCWKEC